MAPQRKLRRHFFACDIVQPICRFRRPVTVINQGGRHTRALKGTQVMQIGSILAIFFVVWWLCLFVVLPIGARSQLDAGEVVPGTEPGAPVVVRLWRQLAATTVLAGFMTALLFWGLSNETLQRYWS